MYFVLEIQIIYINKRFQFKFRHLNKTSYSPCIVPLSFKKHLL